MDLSLHGVEPLLAAEPGDAAALSDDEPEEHNAKLAEFASSDLLLERAELDNADLTEDDAPELAALLKKRRSWLVFINLEKNNLGDEGVELVCKALHGVSALCCSARNSIWKCRHQRYKRLIWAGMESPTLVRDRLTSPFS